MCSEELGSQGEGAKMQDSGTRGPQTQYLRSRPTAAPSSTRTVGTVAAGAVRHLILVGISAGIPRDVLTAAAGVSESDLRDPDARISLTAEIALWQTLARYIKGP